LVSDYFNDDTCISICRDECPSTSYDLSVSHEDFILDLESSSVKEYPHIKTYSSPHYLIYPTIENMSTCDEDTSCSLVSTSNELCSRLRQGSEVVDDETKK